MAETNNVITDDHKSEYLENVFTIRNDPVMRDALNASSMLIKKNKIILYARGNSIPNAVAVANIITEKMLNGKSSVEKITVDSEIPKSMGRMLSTIKIVLIRNS